MIDGILFLLIIINLAATLTIYIFYSRTKNERDDVRQEMSEMISKFNKDAERNIQILEDRIQKAKVLSNKINSVPQDQPIKKPPKTQISKSLDKDNDSKKESVQKYSLPVFESMSKAETNNFIGIKKTSNRKSMNHPSILKAEEYLSKKPNSKKTYVQKAYHLSTNKDSLESNLNNNIEKKGADLPEQSHNKDKTHLIARLIGEGKSLEEISHTLEISQGEIKLFTSLFRKKLAK